MKRLNASYSQLSSGSRLRILCLSNELRSWRAETLSDTASATTHSQPSNYLHRIDEAVIASEPLQRWLEQRLSQDGRTPSKPARLLMQSLKDRVEASRWLNDPLLIPLLPIVLRAASNPQDLSGLEPWYRLQLKRPAGWWGLLRSFSYPLLVGLIALAVMYVFSAFIIPIFKTMFEEFELKLPGPTQAAFSIASFIANYTLLAVGELLVSIGVVIGVLKFIGFVLDHLERNRLIAFLRLGNKKNLGAMARWTGALSELLAIGTPQALAVTTAGIASQRPWLRQQSVRLAQEAAGTGYRWSERWYARSFARSAIVALDLHSEGIASASLLRDLAQSYAIRWCGRGDLFYGWMGPILMLFIAKLIFFIVFSLFMPLFSLVTSLSS